MLFQVEKCIFFLCYHMILQLIGARTNFIIQLGGPFSLFISQSKNPSPANLGTWTIHDHNTRGRFFTPIILADQTAYH